MHFFILLQYLFPEEFEILTEKEKTGKKLN